MSSDETERPEREEDSPSSGPSGPSRNGPGPEMDRLPPPAFPPGSRRTSVPRSPGRTDGGEAGAEEDGETVPDEAFIQPDEPIRKEARGIPDDAFISPDDPFVPADYDEEGEVTPMSTEVDTRTRTATKHRSSAPSIHELPYLLDRVAEQINEAGEDALNVHHEMGHFEAALKSFLRGYLEGTGD